MKTTPHWILLAPTLFGLTAFAQGTSGGGGSLPFYVANGEQRSVLPKDLRLTCDRLGITASAEKVRLEVILNAERDFIATLPKDIKNGQPATSLKDIGEYMRKDLPRVQEDAFRKDSMKPEHLKIILEKYPQYLQMYLQDIDWLADYERRVYQNASDTITPANLEDRVSKIAGLIAAEIKSEPKFDPATQAQMVDRLQSVQVVTANSIAKAAHAAGKDVNALPNIAMDALVFSILCGEKLGQVNAFALSYPGFAELNKKDAILKPKLIVCPGLVSILGPLKNKDHGLDFSIAHDLSHFIAINPVSKLGSGASNAFNFDANLIRQQNSFLSCIDSHYGDKLRTLHEVIELLQPIVSEVEKNRDPNQALMQSLGASVMGLFAYHGEEMALKIAKMQQAAAVQTLGHEASGIESHSIELIADYWATRVIAPQVAKESVARAIPIEEAVGSYIPLFCSLPPVIQKLEDGDEGVHPSLEFRIENFLRHPSLKKAIRQSGVISRPRGRWCEL